jgi:aminopeptidase N
MINYCSGDDTITTTFQRSPIMSSYLNAWVISDFASRSLDNGPQVTRHSIYARLEDVEKVKSALDHSFLFLKQLEDYCSYKYELSKMYSAAIPDFAAGAMENWVEELNLMMTVKLIQFWVIFRVSFFIESTI